MSHRQANLAVLDSVDCGRLVVALDVAVAAAGETAVTVTPLRATVGRRLSLAFASVRHRIALFAAAGQLGSAASLERARSTGARC